MVSAEKERDRVDEKLAEVLPEMDKLQVQEDALRFQLFHMLKGLPHHTRMDLMSDKPEFRDEALAVGYLL
jgi:hypothetical protein